MHPDYNLLVTLEALLSEGSVAGAARRLRLSPSAMSRSLARLRQTTGDPLLVRAGRGLVPTPRALELQAQLPQLLQEVDAVLRPVESLDLSRLDRVFTLRNREGFVENFGPALIARLAAEAPQVRLHFLAKPDRDSQSLRDGSVDLETGVLGETLGPELRSQLLFRDSFVGVVRQDHPLSHGIIDLDRFAQGRHIHVSRRGKAVGPVDEALAALGRQRDIAALVGGFSEALALAQGSDLIATLPERYTGRLRDGFFTFPLPLALPELPISLIWHPRMEADPAHRWLRGVLREVCSNG